MYPLSNFAFVNSEDLNNMYTWELWHTHRVVASQENHLRFPSVIVEPCKFLSRARWNLVGVDISLYYSVLEMPPGLPYFVTYP